ncbi:MAG: family 20 glycosylhydrolase [Candidatus Cryptobacteroides sp.]
MKTRILLTIMTTMLLSMLPMNAKTERQDNFKVKAMYVDFRTQVHTMPALKQLAKEVAGLGMNTMLLEYEATFPFDGHATLKNRYAFTKEEIKELVDYCTGLGLDVIPLQNCMGHSQYILRHDRYAELREDAKDMSQVCPLKIDEAVKTFTEIFREVAALHPSKYFHIGCDETFLLGSCPDCSAYSEKYGKSKLFVEYVKAMCNIVREMGKTPIIWADIILKHPENLNELPDDLIYMDWNYGWDVNRFGQISNLLDAGVNLWGATALRSAPDDIYLTQWEKHFNNLRDFVPFARKSGYQGIVQTSWSTSGAYSYTYSVKNEVLEMYPLRSVYPESGFNILIEASAWAYNHTEPLDPKGFVLDYAKRQFGFSDEDAMTLWDYFTMPQESVSTRNGKDAKGRTIKEVIEEAKAMKARIDGLKPKNNQTEIEHLRLMLDIRINYLEFKQCETEYESKTYNESKREGLAKRMKAICEEGNRLDKRFRKLNKDYLKSGEITYITHLRGDKMNTFYKTLTYLPE